VVAVRLYDGCCYLIGRRRNWKPDRKRPLPLLYKRIATNRRTNRRCGRPQTSTGSTFSANSEHAAVSLPKTKWLHIDDAQRWQILKAMTDGMPNCNAHCEVAQVMNNDGSPEFRKTQKIWTELQQPFFLQAGASLKLIRIFHLLDFPFL
jgi:hypothetical protein